MLNTIVTFLLIKQCNSGYIAWLILKIIIIDFD